MNIHACIMVTHNISDQLRHVSYQILFLTCHGSLSRVSAGFSQFSTPGEVLDGVRHVVAMQIAHDPVVRKCVRQAFRERARLKVRPTPKGRKDIDEDHCCYTMKYLIDKPLTDMRDEQFIKLQQVGPNANSDT